MDCMADLIDAVGEDAGGRDWHGKLNYFKDLDSGAVFGVGDYQADLIFENEDVV